MERDIATLDRLLPRLALSLKSTLTYQFTENVLDTYVGHDAAGRIPDGDIRLGSADVIRAVLVFTDLHGFTRLADTARRKEMMETLNSFFNCMVGPITDRAGRCLSLSVMVFSWYSIWRTGPTDRFARIPYRQPLRR